MIDKIKTVAHYVIVFAIATGILYGAFAIASWSLNIGDWHMILRCMFSFTELCAAVHVAGELLEEL